MSFLNNTTAAGAINEQLPYGKIIVIKRSGQDSASFDLLDSAYVFGRSESCDIRIQIPSVSEEHCRVYWDAALGLAQVQCLSALGVTVTRGGEDMQVKVGESSVLRAMDVMTIVERSFRYETLPNMRQKVNISLPGTPSVSNLPGTPSKKQAAPVTPARFETPTKFEVHEITESGPKMVAPPAHLLSPPIQQSNSVGSPLKQGAARTPVKAPLASFVTSPLGMPPVREPVPASPLKQPAQRPQFTESEITGTPGKTPKKSAAFTEVDITPKKKEQTPKKDETPKKETPSKAIIVSNTPKQGTKEEKMEEEVQQEEIAVCTPVAQTRDLERITPASRNTPRPLDLDATLLKSPALQVDHEVTTSPRLSPRVTLINQPNEAQSPLQQHQGKGLSPEQRALLMSPEIEKIISARKPLNVLSPSAIAVDARELMDVESPTRQRGPLSVPELLLTGQQQQEEEFSLPITQELEQLHERKEGAYKIELVDQQIELEAFQLGAIEPALIEPIEQAMQESIEEQINQDLIEQQSTSMGQESTTEEIEQAMNAQTQEVEADVMDAHEAEAMQVYAEEDTSIDGKNGDEKVEQELVTIDDLEINFSSVPLESQEPLQENSMEEGTTEITVAEEISLQPVEEAEQAELESAVQEATVEMQEYIVEEHIAEPMAESTEVLSMEAELEQLTTAEQLATAEASIESTEQAETTEQVETNPVAEASIETATEITNEAVSESVEVQEEEAVVVQEGILVEEPTEEVVEHMEIDEAITQAVTYQQSVTQESSQEGEVAESPRRSSRVRKSIAPLTPSRPMTPRSAAKRTKLSNVTNADTKVEESKSVVEQTTMQQLYEAEPEQNVVEEQNVEKQIVEGREEEQEEEEETNAASVRRSTRARTPKTQPATSARKSASTTKKRTVSSLKQQQEAEDDNSPLLRRRPALSEEVNQEEIEEDKENVSTSKRQKKVTDVAPEEATTPQRALRRSTRASSAKK